MESANAERCVYGFTSSQQDLSETTIFVLCAPYVLEKIGSEMRPKGLCCLPCYLARYRTVDIDVEAMLVYQTAGRGELVS